MKKKLKTILSLSLKFLIPILAIIIFQNKKKGNDKKIEDYFNPPKYKYKKYTNIKNNVYDLSFIIPVYNSENFLNKCIDSILSNKTKFTYEIIIIDDGSTDNSYNIIQQFKEKYKNIKVFKQDNRGAAKARNLGLDNASGKYISFLDSDDYIDEKYIETLMNIAIKKDSDMVKCGYFEAYENYRKKVDIEEMDIINGFQDKALKMSGFTTMGIIKRKLFYNLRFPEGYWYEDIIVRPLLYTRCKKVTVIKDCLYYYRQHNNNISKTVEHAKDYRCLSQYLLSKYILEYANSLNIKIDCTFKRIMLYEFGRMCYQRTRKLSKKERKVILHLCFEQLQKLNILPTDLKTFEEKYFFKSLEKKSLLLCALTYKYSIWNAK